MLRIVRIALCREPDEALAEQEDLERVEAGDKDVDTQVVLEAVNQVRVRYVLTHDIASFAAHLRLRPNNLDTLTTGAR